MLFFFVALVGMYVGRRLGWYLSKNWLYTVHVGIAAIVCVFWGILVAYSVNLLINWQEPGLILKIIMGYALGCYVAIPNFGLFKRETVSPASMSRHLMAFWFPLVVYALCSLGFAYF